MALPKPCFKVMSFFPWQSRSRKPCAARLTEGCAWLSRKQRGGLSDQTDSGPNQWLFKFIVLSMGQNNVSGPCGSCGEMSRVGFACMRHFSWEEVVWRFQSLQLLWLACSDRLHTTSHQSIFHQGTRTMQFGVFRSLSSRGTSTCTSCMCQSMFSDCLSHVSFCHC